MACEACKQETAKGEHVAYYRFGNANIAMFGCAEHLRQVFEVLSNYQVLKLRKEGVG